MQGRQNRLWPRQLSRALMNFAGDGDVDDESRPQDPESTLRTEKKARTPSESLQKLAHEHASAVEPCRRIWEHPWSRLRVNLIFRVLPRRRQDTEQVNAGTRSSKEYQNFQVRTARARIHFDVLVRRRQDKGACQIPRVRGRISRCSKASSACGGPLSRKTRRRCPHPLPCNHHPSSVHVVQKTSKGPYCPGNCTGVSTPCVVQKRSSHRISCVHVYRRARATSSTHVLRHPTWGEGMPSPSPRPPSPRRKRRQRPLTDTSTHVPV